ncbi:citrate lyase acyl carrier protein [Peloplasma aerotolerans]|jgi:citrate lyase subunit gamma (acyl carrier protein)|uniref:Citrate lyase acyl carrier protein n=1 Tax=Peloplasma aerotolerans TaxID=3044389 RepID=A0AAW6UB13_9MOLU|nr:citrate lyase acyl carrier protein [Mariniplasma sp. M4Ah]MDI6453378.1 citrate lyase acyl carrier protein [Mariniplasma sp. M4Ah]MDR4968376.1 citrate lyase acyl carrier protein [Acholeplasmataceae bacterium]
MKIASCGTIESNDCLITIKKNHETKIDIESIVYDQFKDQIEKVIQDTLKEMKMHNVHVHIQDKGALDYTIRARLITAIERMEEDHA